MRPLPRSLPPQPAFSLVEIVLALGIVGVIMISALGILSVSLNTDRASAADTAVASMSEFLMSDFRSRAVTNFSGLAGQAQSNYFDAQGNWLGTNTSTQAIYLCAATFTTTNAPGINTFYDVTLRFTWPHPQTNNQRTLRASLANY